MLWFFKILIVFDLGEESESEDSEGKILFVKNLNFESTEETLKEVNNSFLKILVLLCWFINLQKKS